jgi:hypothetical protein
MEGFDEEFENGCGRIEGSSENRSGFKDELAVNIDLLLVSEVVFLHQIS